MQDAQGQGGAVSGLAGPNARAYGVYEVRFGAVARRRSLGENESSAPSRGAPLAGADGAVASSVALVTGATTPMRRTRRAPARTDRDGFNYLDAMPEAVLVCDRRGRTLRANHAFRELFGLRAGDDVLLAVARERTKLLHIRDARGRRLTAERNPVSIVLGGATLQRRTAIDLHMRAVDGRELTVSVTGAPVRDEQGHVSGALMLYRDVTSERRRDDRAAKAVQALTAMAALLSDTTVSSDRAAEPVLKRDGDTNRRLADLACVALGCQQLFWAATEPPEFTISPLASCRTAHAHSPCGQPHRSGPCHLSDFLAPAQVAQLQAGEVITQMVPVSGAQDSGGGAHRVERTQAHLAGRHAPPVGADPAPQDRAVVIAPLRLSGALVGVLGAAFGPEKPLPDDGDQSLVRALAHLASALLQRDRLRRENEASHAREVESRALIERLDEFISVASHDLRQPVTGSMGYLQLAERHLQDALSDELAAVPDLAPKLQRVAQDLARADENSSRLLRLISRLFDVARIRAGQFDVRPEPVDLVGLVRTIVAEQRLTQNTHPIQCRLAPTALWVRADTERIGQVLVNYLSNAVRYSPEGSPISVRMRVVDGSAHVSVRDRGCGIVPENLDRVWSRFERSSASSTRFESGLGLGLYISKRIVELHGGQVGVASTSGAGSTFWLTLPLAQPHD